MTTLPRPAVGRLVLVIDDDPTVGDLMTRVLSREGFRVDTPRAASPDSDSPGSTGRT